MAAFNQCTFAGNLCTDPVDDLRYTPQGTAVCDARLAINEKYTSGGEKKERVCFMPITVWGETAKNLAKYLKKGDPVLVSGRMVQEQWQDEKSGENRSRLKCVVESLQFLNRGKGDGIEYQVMRGGDVITTRKLEHGDKIIKPTNPEDEFNGEDIPF